jgi:hypothetical protein
LENFKISWSNIPQGASFEWYSDGVILPNPYNARNGQNINYILTYSNGSKSIGSFTVSGDFNLDLRTLEPNKFIVSISSNKTLSTVRVYHNWSSGSTEYIDIKTFTNNTAKIECDKDEDIKVSVKCAGWTEIDKLTDDQNLNSSSHYYTDITQNISETYSFDYVAYDSIRIFLKDENGNYVEMTNDPYWSYITWTPSISSKFNPVGVIVRQSPDPDYYNAYKDSSISVNYTINIPNYAPINGTFGSTSTQPTQYYEQTKTLVPMVTYTVVPLVDNPQDATITFAVSGYTGEGNRITVPKGTTVAWVIDCPGYISKAGSAYVDRTFTAYVQMDTDDTHEINITDYEYTNINYHLELNKYIGSDGNVTIPNV